MKRNEFLSLVAGTSASWIISPAYSQSSKEKPPALPDEMVREFVGAGHNNLERVKEMLKVQPNLLYAKWDWGGGDFESALEGAGHVGDAEIAGFLISQGARPNIFVWTMLGLSGIVIPMLDAFPEMLHSKGPHGYTLLHHAARGGEAAAGMYQYLQEKGLKETRLPLY